MLRLALDCDETAYWPHHAMGLFLLNQERYTEAGEMFEWCFEQEARRRQSRGTPADVPPLSPCENAPACIRYRMRQRILPSNNDGIVRVSTKNGQLDLILLRPIYCAF